MERMEENYHGISLDACSFYLSSLSAGVTEEFEYLISIQLKKCCVLLFKTCSIFEITAFEMQ